MSRLKFVNNKNVVLIRATKPMADGRLAFQVSPEHIKNGSRVARHRQIWLHSEYNQTLAVLTAKDFKNAALEGKVSYVFYCYPEGWSGKKQQSETSAQRQHLYKQSIVMRNVSRDVVEKFVDLAANF